ncbi:phosphatase PAP2 family protein [Haloarchaeobius sp. TZWWS8]|uniref:phosphatase PAP2 family protein n=1 Tax=Haloarchaeobius sp. TZWWS8 TaxID=3446121 RepID=UPI003EBC304A
MTTASRDHWGVLTLFVTLAVTAGIVATAVFSLELSQRSLGIVEAVVSESTAVLLGFGLVTQFGDPWFLLLVASAVYLLGASRGIVERPADGAFVVAVAYGAFALTDVLKHAYRFPRPPGADTVTIPEWLPSALAGLFRNLTTGTGYGFPSGHALGTTAVFCALAYKLSVGSSRTRWGVASLGIGVIAVSRLVLGVHFFVDLVVGVATGLAFLGAAIWVGDDDPTKVFGLAAVLGGIAVVAAALEPTGSVWSAGQWLGAATGAGYVWMRVRPSRSLGIVPALLAAGPLGVIWVAAYAWSPHVVVTVLLTAVLGGWTVGAPVLVSRLAVDRSSSRA